MKKIQILIPALVLVITVFLISCSKTDSTPQGPQLKGTWNYHGWSNQNCLDPTLNPLGFVCTTCKEIWTDSTITGTGMTNYTAKYRVSGNSIIFTDSKNDLHFTDSTYHGTYKLTSDSLIITIDAPWSGCQMVKRLSR